jgi:hypothetical protein
LIDIEFWELLRYLLAPASAKSGNSLPLDPTAIQSPRQPQPTISKPTPNLVESTRNVSPIPNSSSHNSLTQPPIYQTAKDTKRSVLEKSALYTQHTQYKDTDVATEKRISDFQLLMGMLFFVALINSRLFIIFIYL